MIKIDKKFWYEVFKECEKGGGTETIFSHEDLEECIKVYRKEKKIGKSVKIDKWINASFLDIPISVQLILN